MNRCEQCGERINPNYLTDHYIQFPHHRQQMTELIIYTDRCLTCEEGDRLNKVRQFAKDHNLKFTMKQAYVFRELKLEAETFGAQMPFIVLNNKTLRFYNVSPDPRLHELDQLLN